MTFLLIARTIFVIVCQPQTLVLKLAPALCRQPPCKNWDSCQDTIKKITIVIPASASQSWLESLLENMVESSALATGSWRTVTPCHPRAKCFTNSMCLFLNPWIATKVSKTIASVNFSTLRHRMWKLLHLLRAVTQQASKLLPVNPNAVIEAAAQEHRGMG